MVLLDEFVARDLDPNDSGHPARPAPGRRERERRNRSRAGIGMRSMRGRVPVAPRPQLHIKRNPEISGATHPGTDK